jgi:glutaredoxin|tara:strand:+ start:322 stop:555 length:234 start_codon:yes stop_codon:yes gene_type:complete
MIIKFMTEGCAPCRAVSQVLDLLGIEYEEVNIATDITRAVEHRIRSVPTIVNTETGATLIGFKGIYHTEEWVNDNCN